jgi:DNA-binding transcriptional regulator YiaG
MTDSETIRRIGEALFGRQWQTDLAEALSVSSRTVRRWAAGEERPRPGVWQDLAELLREHEQHIRQILDGDDLAQRIGRG